MSLTVLVDTGPWLPVPPRGYGGIETVVSTLVPELRALGARVVLAGVGSSTLEVDELVATVPDGRLASLRQPYNQVMGQAHAHMQAVVERLREGDHIDVVHDHLEVVGPAVLAAMGTAAPPTLQTLHWDLAKHADFYSSFDGRGRVRFAAVSASQLARAPANLRAQACAVVPLWVPPPPVVAVPRADHAVVLCRVTPDKGQDLAVRACRAAGVPVVLAGPVAGIDDPEELARRLERDPALRTNPDVDFFLSEVAPLLDGRSATWVGGVQGEEKERLLQSARALLTPVRWAEPGATAVVEALARGVPVVATPLGVLPELVVDGVNGFLAADVDGLAAGLRRLDRIDADTCRASVADRTPRAAAERYLQLFEALVDEARPRSGAGSGVRVASRTAAAR